MVKYISLSLLLATCTLLPGCGACTREEAKSTVATDVADASGITKEVTQPMAGTPGQEPQVEAMATTAQARKGEVIEFSANRGDPKAQLNSMIAQGTAVVDFYAPWCGPCKALAPQLANLARERTDVTFIKIDVDQFPQFGIRSMPTILIYKNGSEVKRVVGANLPAIKEAIK